VGAKFRIVYIGYVFDVFYNTTSNKVKLFFLDDKKTLKQQHAKLLFNKVFYYLQREGFVDIDSVLLE
jgi:hypothetical protein